MSDDIVIVIGGEGEGRRKALLVAIGVAVVVVLLALVFYHPTTVVTPPPPITNVTPATSYVVLSVADLPSDPALNVTIGNAYLELSNGTWLTCPINKTFNMYQLVNVSQIASICEVPANVSIIAVSINITQVVYINVTTMSCGVPAHFITIDLMSAVTVNSTTGANVTIDMQMVKYINVTSFGCFVTPRFFVYIRHLNVTLIKHVWVPVAGKHKVRLAPAPFIPINGTVPINSTSYPPIINGTGFNCTVVSYTPPKIICNATLPKFPPRMPRPANGSLTLVIYNPSNQPTNNPHDQPITMSCPFLQALWQESLGYTPSCQSIAYNVTFMEDGQVLPAYPVVNGDSITWWVRMPAIPAMSSVNVTMILGNSSSITSPQNVFLIYGNISSFQPGYIYTLNVTRGITTIYNPSATSAFVYVANNSVWLFTPNSNSTINGYAANLIGSGYLSIAVTPGGQYLVGAQPSLGAPFKNTYQITSLSGIYSIVYIPQSVLDALAGLGAAYVTSLVNPPALSGYTAPQVHLNPYYLQLPQCSISSNPYPNGKTGTFSLLNCLAINNGGTWAVIRFYLPPGGMGTILGFQAYSYPIPYPYGWSPWIYVCTNGYLNIVDYFGANGYDTLSISPGWHILIAGEYYSGGTYYITAYLDTPSNNKTVTTTLLPQLFGFNYIFPYGYIGTGFTNGWANGNGGYFFFDGVIAYVALYPGGSSEGTSLINNGVFNIASQTQSTVPGFAIDYPPDGIEPIVVGAYVSTPVGLSILLPSQLGIINYAIHVAQPATPLGTGALITP